MQKKDLIRILERKTNAQNAIKSIAKVRGEMDQMWKSIILTSVGENADIGNLVVGDL